MIIRSSSPSSSKEAKVRINDEITAAEVRLIGADGAQLGIVSLNDALRRSEALSMDLVEISPTADPPVCRMMDYGKFLFEQNKKSALARKNQKRTQVKTIQMRPTTDKADYEVKLRNAQRFLEDGDKVKVTLRFRGREMDHQQYGLSLLERLRQELEALGVVVEQPPKLEGRQLVMLLAPKKGGLSSTKK